MRRTGQALAIAGVILLFSPEWVPLDPWLVRGIAAALLLGGLTAAIVGSVLGNLPEEARMDPVDEIPASCRAAVERIEALGFARLGPALRVHIDPAAVLVPLWHAGERAYATVFVSDGAPAQAHYDFVTVFEPGEVALTSSPSPAAGVLPPAPGTFLQIFPRAEPEDLFPRHLEGCAHLAPAAGLQPMRCCDRFEELLARALRRQRHAFLRAPLRHAWTALWRVLGRRPPTLGPVAAQRDTRDRIEALASPADGALAVG